MKQNESYLNIPIHSFNSLGDPIYVFKDESGHKYFDICNCENCMMTDSNEDDYPKKRNKNKKSSQQILKEKYISRDPNIGLLGEPTGKTFEYYVQYSSQEKLTNPQKEIPNYFMFGPSSSQDKNFPPTEFEEENSKHSWKIKNSVIKNPDGSTKQISAAEATLNWQSEYARAQNNLLQQLDKKVTVMDLAVKEIHQKISSLHQELLRLATTIANPKIKKSTSQCSVDEVLMPEFMMAEPTQVEEVVESDTENPEGTEQLETHPPPGWNPKG
ncbi:uncharacterized protein LOC141636627 [Silene latifolia]|uniref:uncharacterized protein LOC141636627 n=1 Tax=Silene latifolia TaxID=37657 RepID=UPI003D777C87